MARQAIETSDAKMPGAIEENRSASAAARSGAAAAARRRRSAAIRASGCRRRGARRRDALWRRSGSEPGHARKKTIHAAVPANAAAAARSRGSGEERAVPRDIITCPPLRITRIGAVLHQMGLRARALTGRPRTFRRRVPRLLVHLAAADQRPARRADGGAQQDADAVLRGDGDARDRSPAATCSI